MTTRIFSIEDHKDFKQKMLNWVNRFSIFCFMDNNDYQFEKPGFDLMVAAGNKRSISLPQKDAFQALYSFYQQQPSWLFGHLGYGLKDQLEDLKSAHKDFIDFERGFFFEPEVILHTKKNQLSIVGDTYNADEVFNAILQTPAEIFVTKQTVGNPVSNMTRQEYLDTLGALQKHIHRGDCYEINFCQQFSVQPARINPLAVYQQLVTLSPNPFSVLYKFNHKYCLCASPERYLKKTGSTIVSQPIKGTSRRTVDPATDEKNKNHLSSSAKERSENVMIVDLVRNDLSRICKEGTVLVDELFGIYSFPQVHQMISTIKGELKAELNWTDAIKATFPMGSMTGAPKKRVMELIDQYEPSARGLFSGSIGYVNPAGDFDFNVVIRSFFYDAKNEILCFSAGGGITANSNAEEEYAESLLKAGAMFNVLENLKGERLD